VTAVPSSHGARPLRGVLLDVDGTLLDSNQAHADAFADVFREWGMTIPAARVLPLIGMGGDKLIPELTGLDAESDEGKRLAKAKSRRFTEHYLPRLSPTPGARAFVERLQAAGLRLVVATSAGGSEVEGLLERAGIADLLPTTTTSSDAESSKPDPDIIEAALAKGGLAPDETLMVGDTTYDIEAAGRAGVRCVAFRSGGWDDASLAGAIAIFDSPADALARFDASPFASPPPGVTP